jgi:hypothetical protein
VSVTRGARADLARVALEGNAYAGLNVDGTDTSATVEDLRVAGTLPVTDAGLLTAGVLVENGATAEITRAVLEANALRGAAASGAGSALSLEDVQILGTLPGENTGLLGLGLLVEDGATASVLRGLVDGSRFLGIESRGAAALALEDVSVLDTLSLASDGRFGRGLHAEGGGAITITHSEFSGNRDVSLAVFDEGTTVLLSDVRIVDSQERSCVDLDDDDVNHCNAGRGYGLGAYDGAPVTVDGVAISEATSAGVQIAGGGTVSGPGLRVSRCGVGLNLQEPPRGWSVDDDLADLLLSGNGADVDESAMSVPERLPE